MTWLQPLTGGPVPASAKPTPSTARARHLEDTRPTSFSLTVERIAKLKRIAGRGNVTAWISEQIDNAPEPK